MPYDEQKGYPCIDVAMLTFEAVQPITKQMENQKEVDDDKNRIDRQLNGKGSETFRSLLFHSG